MSRRHTKVPEGLLLGNKFLNESISQDGEDDSMIICKLCDSHLYYENLIGHLTKVHLNQGTSKKEHQMVVDAIEYLNFWKKPTRNSQNSVKSLDNSDILDGVDKYRPKKVTRKPNIKDEIRVG